MNTFRMVIADDEPLIRKGLRALIGRIAPHWVIAGDAANGQEALDLIRAAKPDLVLTDISMPVMNGIELFAALKQEGESLPYVLALSGFTDYAYVRDMLLMGAVDYLTKPVEEPVLIEKLRQIEQRILASFQEKLEDNEQNRQLSEYWFHQLLRGDNYPAEDCEERLRLLGIPTEGVSYGTIGLHHDASGLPVADRSLYLYFLLKTSQELVPSDGIVIRAEDGMVLVLMWSSDADSLRERLLQFREGLLSFTREFTRMKVVLGGSSVFPEFRKLQASWEQVTIEIRYQLDAPSSADAMEWMVALRQGDLSKISGIVQGSFPAKQPERWREQFRDRAVLLRQFASAAGLADRPDDWPSAVEPERGEQSLRSREYWIAKLEDLAKEVLERVRLARSHKDPHLIVRVKQYIQTHLGGNLTLQAAATHVRMNPSYLSEVFKQSTGINFIDYVIQQRMELAKQLLSEDKHKLYEISSMVGYQSTKHFTALFKRVVGVLPSEYKRYV